MFKNQQANITFELASDRTNAHNSREEKPSYLMPGYYLNEKYGIMKKPVRHIRLNKLSFDDLWQKRRDEMKYEVSHLGKIKLIDKHKGKKPLKQNCHYECVIGLNEHTQLSSLLKSIKAVSKILNIEPINLYIHNDEGHLLRKSDNKEIFPLFHDENGKLGGTYITDKDGRAYYIHIKESINGKQYYEKGAELEYEEFEPIFQKHAHVEWNSLVNGRNQMQRFKKNTTDPNLDYKTVFKTVYNTNAEILGMIKGDGGSKHKKLKAFRVASENDKLMKKLEELEAIIEKDETYIEIITGYSEDQKVKIEELEHENQTLRTRLSDQESLYKAQETELQTTKNEFCKTNQELITKNSEIELAREEIRQVKEEIYNLVITHANTNIKLKRELEHFGIAFPVEIKAQELNSNLEVIASINLS